MIKRTLISFLVLMTAVVMQAQSLNGKWTTLLEIDEETPKVNLTMTFSGSNIQIAGDFNMDDERIGNIALKLTAIGTFKRSGDNLSINLDKDKFALDIVKIEYTQEIKDAMKEEPELEGVLTSLLKMGMKEQKEGLADGFPLSGEVKIVSLTANKLTLSTGDDEDDETIEFTRAK